MTPSQPSAPPPNINYDINKKPPVPHRPFSDPNHLAPEDAFYAHSPPRRQRQIDDFLSVNNRDVAATDSPSIRAGGSSRRRRGKDRGRSGSRRGKNVWKKLLWVKQKDYPDNYTDPPTFLSALQRNPRLRPYDFWPLVADSTVIAQHISSVVIFVCSFVGIYQQRVSPVSVVSWGSAGTVLGWILWDFWIGQEALSRTVAELSHSHGEFANGSAVSGASSPIASTAPTPSLQSATSSTVGASLGTALSKKELWNGGWKRAIAGAVIWSVGSAVGMGGCSWWLIGLQRYKNVVIGPWDPARPIIRGGQWDQG
ncbi:phosphatidylinositol N-acetylglucosaminyltransferase subunit C, partial [Lecanoromycetidae sp. Uapishka_2]